MSIRKAVKASLAILILGGLTAVLPAPSSIARAADAPNDSPKATGVGDEAVSALSRMSKTLQAKQFSFTARTFRGYPGPNGALLHIVHTIKAVVSRPDKISLNVTGDDGSSQLVYDGKNLTVYVAAQKRYASAPVSGGIDDALDFAEERAGIEFPLSDLIAADPGNSLLADVTSGGQVGTSTIDGVACRHYFFVQASEDLVWELWLEDNDQALPRRVIVTYRGLAGRPIFYAELSNWQLSSQTADSDFEFKPPANVTKVDFAPAPSAASQNAPNAVIPPSQK
jgi:hypothetical protein